MVLPAEAWNLFTETLDDVYPGLVTNFYCYIPDILDLDVAVFLDWLECE